MASKIKFLLLYFVSWVVFFELMRILFLVYHSDKTSGLPFGTVAQTFWHGLRMDLSVSAYILLLVAFFVLLSLAVPFFRKLIIYKVYTFIALLLAAIICVADLELYTAWGFRIDNTPLKFLTSPKEAFASISHLPLLWISLAFVIVFGIFFYVFVLVMRASFFSSGYDDTASTPRYKALTALMLVVIMVAMLVPIRGGFQQSPLNQSSVYFSTNTYANHAAINACWNFLHSVLSHGNSGKNPYQYMADADTQPIIDSLYRGMIPDGDTTPQTNRHSSGPTEWLHAESGKPINVIVVVWESFTEKAIHLSISNKEVTPRFNQFKKEGIFFTNSFASGDRTNKGIPAIFSGYPAMPNTTIIHNPGKSAKLNTISKVFRDKGYSVPFFYGGETEFANIKSYLLHGGFDPIIGKSDFAAADMNSKWGAHDGIVMKRVLADLAKTKEPFFAGWLTLSSHEPFETPVPVVFPGKENTSLFLNSLHYTDQVLGDFIDSCKRQPWWEHTVIIIIGDHGHPLPETGKRVDDFRTPMLWTGGAVTQKGLMVEKVVSQLDIATTLANQFVLDSLNRSKTTSGQAGGAGKLSGAHLPRSLASGTSTVFPAAGRQLFPYSKDMADTATIPWAFFTFNDGFGFVDTSGVLVWDNVGKQPIMRTENSGKLQERAGKALQEGTYGDFLKK